MISNGKIPIIHQKLDILTMMMRKISRKEREQEILFGLITLYIKQGKPVSSNTLKEEGFGHLSSATIRNYFSHLEKNGFLKQHHTSGGRLPTDKGYRLYAKKEVKKVFISKDDDLFIRSILLNETKTISLYLQKASQAISELTKCAIFLASPRFDQDFIIKIRLMKIDEERLLCAILTDFGQIHTEIIYFSININNSFMERIEAYFRYRLTGSNCPIFSKEEEVIAKQIYNEIVLRHFVSYTNIFSEDIYKAGFAKLLQHAEFHDPKVLSSTLSLFENVDTIRFLLHECFKKEETKFWIGDDLKKQLISPPYQASLIATPYRIGEKVVGVLATLGPDRLPYGKIFGVLYQSALYLSQNLTQSMYKFKLTYRQPKSKILDMKQASSNILGLTHKKESNHHGP